MNEIELIKKHEGFREDIYYDTVGVPTGGYGHAFLEGSRLPKNIWKMIFNYDYRNAVNDYNSLELRLDAVRRAVIIDMLFNLGLNKFLTFKKMLDALKEGNYEKAAYEMFNSKWALQVGRRAIELSEMMRSGEWYE